MQRLGWVLLVVGATTSTAAAQFRGFGVHGEAIPGTSDTIDRVSAAAALGDNNVAYIARGGNAQYVVIDVAGADTVIATQGTAAPDGQTYGTFAELHAWGSQVSFSSNGTTYLWSLQTGVRALALGGLVAVNTAGQTLHLSTTLTFVDTGGAQKVIVAANGPVPGDPTFTVESQGIISPYLHENGDVSFQLDAANSGRSIFKSYIFQGPAAAPVLRDSDDTLPTQLGDLRVGLIAASPSGELAWWTSYGTPFPTVPHLEIKLRRSNGAVAVIGESLDFAPITIDGAPYQLDVSGVGRHLHFLSSTQLVMYAAGSSGSASSIVSYGNGGWRKVATDTELLPGATSPGAVVSTVVGDRILLDSPGDGGVWTWTDRKVETIALPGQMFGAFTATNVSSFAGNDADDGVIVAVAHAGTTGATRVSGFITGGSPGGTADFEILGITGRRGKHYSYDGDEYLQVFHLDVTIRNNGPLVDRYVLTGEVDQGVARRLILEKGNLECDEQRCTSVDELAPGEERVVTIMIERGDDAIATISVAPQSKNDPNLDNNMRSIVIREDDPSTCSATTGGGSAPVFIAVALVCLRRRRQ